MIEEKIDLKEFHELSKVMQSVTLMKQIEDMTVSNLDEKIFEGLSSILIKIPENIRILTLGFFEFKSKSMEYKRKLDLHESRIIKNLDKDQSKNKEIRESYVRTDPEWQELKEYYDQFLLLTEKTDQHIWVWRHIESNIRAVANLRATEMRKLGSGSVSPENF